MQEKIKKNIKYTNF